jgi:hypothetical protein
VFGGCCGGCLATPTTPKPPVFKGVPGDFALKMVGVAEKFFFSTLDFLFLRVPNDQF